MGGFVFNYVAGSEELVRGGFTLDDVNSTPTFDWYRVDDTRSLCLIWGRFSTPVSAFVIDYSSPTSVSVGTMIDFEAGHGPADFRVAASQLTATDWIVNLGEGDYQRFSIVGTTISIIDLVQVDFEFFPGDSRVPPALFEGHSDATLEVTWIADSHMTFLGIDFDHILVSGALTWPGGNLEVKWYVIDLTLPAPVAQFDVGATGFYPSPYMPAQDGPGVGYAWVYDTWPPFVDPSGTHLVLVETDGSSISVVEVTGYAWDGNAVFNYPPRDPRLGRATDGSYWLHAVESVAIDGGWSPTNRFPYRTRSLRIDVVTLTSHDYLGELNFFDHPSAPDFAWAIDDDYMADSKGNVSWKLDDGHYRAEQSSGTFPYEVDAPHFRSFPFAACGLSHKRMGYFYAYSATFAQPWDLYFAVYVETGQPPAPDFFASPTSVQVGSPVDFDAQAFTDFRCTDDNTRDSYWHPVLEYRWEWDDGSPDTFTSSNPTTHIYRRNSTTHSAGSQTPDHSIVFPGLFGDIGYYLPELRARNSVGWSYAIGYTEIEVLGQAYIRSFPRDDPLGAGSPRSWPPSTSVQSGPRSGPTAIT